MKAARLHDYGKPLVVEDVPTPEPGPGEVLVRVEGSGFCHSDLHVIDGEIHILPRLPLILGHENAGRVATVGNGVETVVEGDPVVVFGGWGCGRCAYCVTGAEQLCERPQWVGLSQYDGGYAEYLLVPNEQYLIKLDALDPRVAAPLTDAALTPYRAVKKALPFIEPDHKVLVIGIGGLGEFGVKILRLLTASEIIAVDISDRKRAIARELGAHHTLDGQEPNLAEAIMDLTEGHGVCAAFDYVGSEETLSLAIETTRSLGKVSQIGLAGGTARLKVLENSRFEVTFEATLWGTLKELREVVAMVESRNLSPISVEFAPLDAIRDVADRVRSGNVEGRLVITP
ncbi:MAG TPA: NAD(P)-dependent alcohol dehydrogenase [Gemmatimonadota bacterium]|nr:NAD(P)-dependent alcohol dehydrogenase [Gemmatimonadota bacterium]